jgi:transketolase C-terminal domain/subunit
VRNGVSLHGANVKLIGVKGSEKYRFLGFSHNMVFEDEDVYHLNPYINCFTPSDNEEVRKTLLKTHILLKPAYIRL